MQYGFLGVRECDAIGYDRAVIIIDGMTDKVFFVCPDEDAVTQGSHQRTVPGIVAAIGIDHAFVSDVDVTEHFKSGAVQVDIDVQAVII